MRLVTLACISSIITLTTACTPKHKNTAPPASPKQANKFSIKLFKQVATTKNLIMSPYSAYSAFALAYPASAGTTRTALDNFFHYPKDLNRLASLNDHLQTNNKSNTVTISNSLWVQEGINVLPAYQQTIENVFNADLGFLNFHKPKAAAKKINGWASDKTYGLIQKAVTPAAIANQTSVLMNAVYFNCRWDHKFDPKDTKPMLFYVSKTQHNNVPMMNQTYDFDYAQTAKAQIISLPYDKNKYSMLIILPKKGVSLANIRKSLSINQLNQWQQQMHSQSINLSLPKFETSSKINLIPYLKRMGLTQPLSNQANFSKFSTQHSLQINGVLQVAHIIVDEKGTKAAAVTSVMFGNAIVMPITMTINHPFMYIMYKTKPKTILFMGQVTNF
jgi:serpin B